MLYVQKRCYSLQIQLIAITTAFHLYIFHTCSSYTLNHLRYLSILWGQRKLKIINTAIQYPTYKLLVWEFKYTKLEKPLKKVRTHGTHCKKCTFFLPYALHINRWYLTANILRNTDGGTNWRANSWLPVWWLAYHTSTHASLWRVASSRMQLVTNQATIMLKSFYTTFTLL